MIEIQEEGKKVNNGFSRRDFIFGAGKVAAGTAILTAGGLSLASATKSTQLSSESKKISSESKKTTWPWPYKELNPDEVAKIAYENWYKNFCTYAVVSAIFTPLGEKIGEPYTSFPILSTKWGHGGAVGWGTLCGTLTGAGIVTGLIAGEDGEKILNDVIAWYTDTELPIFKPANPKEQINNINKSESPLCHVSVGKWMKKENVKFFTPQRKERCARLSADVAVKTVELLNLWANGKFVPVHFSQTKMHQQTAQNNCMDCHTKK